MKREWLLALVALLSIGSILLNEIEKSAAREIKQRIGGGEVRVVIIPDGVRGLTEGRAQKVIVYASHFSVDGLPFVLEGQYPKTGTMIEFILDMQDVKMTGLRAERVYARIPNVKFDRRTALTKKVFRLSATGEGESEIVVTERSLAEYIEFKYKPFLKQVQVQITPDKTYVSGRALVVIGEFQFRAEGRLVVRDGIYLDLVDTKITFEGQEVPPESVRTLEQWLNPIIDAVKDLKVADGIRVHTLTTDWGKMTARGTAKVPR
jgi:hypothetical protein